MTQVLVRRSAVERTARVQQLEGLFDVPEAKTAGKSWKVDLPVADREWHVGLIVGPSGSGKTTVLREVFGEPQRFEWPATKSVLDGFPASTPIQEITGLLSSVGFSSPPAWVRPFGTLSNGEQFRASLARLLADTGEVARCDEFTSVVDRTVAQVGAAAVGKAVRRSGGRFVAASCHYDVVEWLQPDWVYEPATNRFRWRELGTRPALFCRLVPSTPAAWFYFAPHHYLSADIHRGARCFLLTRDDEPIGFCAALPFPHPKLRDVYRGHRTVVIPDYQGIGVGNALSETVGALFRAAGKVYVSSTSHPAMIRHRAKSALWSMSSAPQLHRPPSAKGRLRNVATQRLTASFRFAGPAAGMTRDEARSFIGIAR